MGVYFYIFASGILHIFFTGKVTVCGISQSLAGRGIVGVLCVLECGICAVAVGLHRLELSLWQDNCWRKVA